MLKLRKRLKAISKNERIKVAQNFDRTEDERAIIEVGARDYESIISSYCVKSYLTLNPGFASYIETNANQVPINDDLQLDIYLDSRPTKKQRKNINSALKVHYAEKIARIQAMNKKTIILSIILLVLGIAVLVGCAFASYYNSLNFLSSIAEILGWILIWDGSEMLIFDLRDGTNNLINSFRIMKARVYFRPYDKENPPITTYDEEEIEELEEEEEKREQEERERELAKEEKEEEDNKEEKETSNDK